MNHLTLVDRLGADPQLRYTNNQRAVTNLRLAVNRPGREDPDWLEVTAWGPTAEAACQHLRKGSKVTVAGRVEADRIELDGKKYSTVKIHASQLDFELAARTDAGAAASREINEGGCRPLKVPTSRPHRRGGPPSLGGTPRCASGHLELGCPVFGVRRSSRIGRR